MKENGQLNSEMTPDLKFLTLLIACLKQIVRYDTEANDNHHVPKQTVIIMY